MSTFISEVNFFYDRVLTAIDSIKSETVIIIALAIIMGFMLEKRICLL